MQFSSTKESMIQMNDEIKTLTEWIQKSQNIVFFGGAGVSTESGIPDFRSESGIYQKEYLCNGRKVSPEECLSIDFALKHPDIFYDYYIHEFIHPTALPNDAHLVLAELERMGKLKSVITQNVDSLHQKAGSQKVLEVHGTVATYSCQNCHRSYTHEDVMHQLETSNVARCTCGGMIRPDIVFYGEPLPTGVFEKAIHDVAHADVFIVAGTSLNVYPAANLMNYYRGNKCVLINLQKTPYDSVADLIIHDKCGKVLKEVMNNISTITDL